MTAGSEVQVTVHAVAKAMQLQGCRSGAKIGIYGANAPESVQGMLVRDLILCRNEE